MNKLLCRQILKIYGSLDKVPEEFMKLLSIIGDTYDHHEKDRKLMERSMELSSNEMIELNNQLGKEKDELKKAHKEKKYFFDNIDEILYSVDMVSYKLLQISPACEKVYGYPYQEFLINADLWKDLIHPEDRHIAEEHLEALYHHKQILSQYRIIHKDKSIRWLENKIIPTFDSSNTLIRIDGITSDITERKQAEIDLEKSFSILEATLESTADGILVEDLKGKVVRINNKLLELWHIPREIAAKGKNKKSVDYILDQLKDPAEFLSKTKAMYSRVNEPSFDLIYFKDGRIFERYSQPHLINGQCAGRVWSFRDVTERVKSEKAILISNERYELVSKATSDVIWDWDLVTNEVIRSQEGMKILFESYSDEDHGNSLFWSSRVHPEDLPGIYEGFDLVINNTSEIYMDSEYRFKKADGKYAYLYDKGYIVRDKNGKAIRMIGACKDISRLKENEIQLRKHAMELSISNQELKQFAYVASHDLQEPLRTIIGFVEMFKKQYYNKLDSEADEYLNFIMEASDRMRVLIKDLLDFSRIGHNKELTQVDCNMVLRDVLADLRNAIKESGAEIKIENLPVIKGYAIELKQLFQNLILNSIKFRKQKIPLQIKVAVEEMGHYWQFSITDNGIGIEEQHSERIFIIFQRLHTRTEYEGSGIGLSHCKKIVELHQGKIWVDSKLYEGSTFYFTIHSSKEK